MSDPLKKMRNPWGLDVLEMEEKEQKAKFEKEQNELNQHYKSCFETSSGKKVLEHLKKCTLEQPVWIPTEGNYGVNNGFVREGQNSVVRNIIDRINNINNKK